MKMTTKKKLSYWKYILTESIGGWIEAPLMLIGAIVILIIII